MTNMEQRIKNKTWVPWTVAGAMILVCLFLGLCFGVSLNLLMCRVLIMSMFAISLNFQMGYAGMGNLGHSLYFGLGGYGVMLLITKLHIGLGPAVVITLISMTLLAFSFGYLTLRSNMLSFMFLTMSLCLVISMLIQKSKWAGSTVGITYTIRPEWLVNPTTFYLLLLAIAAVSIGTMYLLTQTTFMKTVEASRENEERLLFLGVNVSRLRVMIYTISSFFAIIAGIMFAIFNNGVYTTSLDMSLSIQALMMCLIGGVSNFIGPIVGAVLLTFINNYLSKYVSFDNAVLGLIIILCVYFIPNGLTNIRLGQKRLLDKMKKKIKAGK